VMAVAGISTVVFNGNPLMRYDGYYILSDLIEMPNLGARSSRLWAALVDKYAFRIADARLPVGAHGEFKWFIAYAPASFIYRMSVQFGIALFLAGKFFIVGVLLAIWSLTTSVVLPAYRALMYAFASPKLHKVRSRAVGFTLGSIGTAAVMLGLVPFPLHTSTEGVIWLPDDAIVRAGTDGFVRRLLVDLGTFVRAGEALIETDEPQLRATLETLQWRVVELQSVLDATRFSDRPRAELASIELASAQSEAIREQERASRLTAASGAEGTFVLAKSEDLPGRFYHEGEVLGYVTPGSSHIARIVVPQDDVELVRNRFRSVSVKLAQDVTQTYPAQLIREAPSGRNELPSKALGTSGGGVSAVDPGDQQGRKTLQRVFQFDLELPPDTPAAAFGSRVYVRFEHEWEPLGFQWFRRLRQLFLARLNV
jgi:putative peptide zinc metalloprotease protein